jgi:hypothetical protein
LSLSPILSHRIHLAPAAAREPRDWPTIFDGTGLKIIFGEDIVPYGVAIVVPGRESPVPTDSEDAGLEGNATESLWAKCTRQWRSTENLAVIGQPDRDSETADRTWMQDIARAIVRRAFAVEPWGLEDASGLFDRVVEFVQRGEKNPADYALIARFVVDWAPA